MLIVPHSIEQTSVESTPITTLATLLIPQLLKNNGGPSPLMVSLVSVFLFGVCLLSNAQPVVNRLFIVNGSDLDISYTAAVIDTGL